MLERGGTILLAVLVTAILAVQAFSIALNWAADDVRLQFGIVTGRDRTPVGVWLSSTLMSDLPPNAVQARHDRADAFDNFSNRLREIAGASALAGLLIAPLTASAEVRRRSETASPAANTTSNGTA